MKTRSSLAVVGTGLLLLCFIPLAFAARSARADWPQFRGPAGAGVAPANAHIPDGWDVATGEHIAWRADLPGKGPASPIVVGDRVFVTSASGEKQDRLHVLCFDATSGKQRWHRQFWATGRTLTHPSSGNAAPTPASDGRYLFAFYSSNDLICLDLNGNLKWYRGLAFDYPKAGNDIGMSSSPAVADETVIVQLESQGDSFVAALETSTGTTRWRLERPKVANWSSPLTAVGPDGQTVALLKSSEGVDAVGIRDGQIRWKLAAAAGGIPSLVADSHAIFVPGDGLMLFGWPESGDEPPLRWASSRLRPGPASPVVGQGKIFAVNRAGVATCADAETGDSLWQFRLSGTCWATPVLIGERLFCVSDDGTVEVLDVSGSKGKVIDSSAMGQRVQASPAVGADGLYIRTDTHLWKIAQ